MENYNIMELMICVAARELGNGRSAAIGTGAPCAAAMLAQKTLAPHLLVMFESGGIDPVLTELPVSVGDSRTFHLAAMADSMLEIMQTCAGVWLIMPSWTGHKLTGTEISTPPCWDRIIINPQSGCRTAAAPMTSPLCAGALLSCPFRTRNGL